MAVVADRRFQRVTFTAQGAKLEGQTIFKSMLRDEWMVEIPDLGDLFIPTSRLTFPDEETTDAKT